MSHQKSDKSVVVFLRDGCWSRVQLHAKHEGKVFITNDLTIDVAVGQFGYMQKYELKVFLKKCLKRVVIIG